MTDEKKKRIERVLAAHTEDGICLLPSRAFAELFGEGSHAEVTRIRKRLGIEFATDGVSRLPFGMPG